MRSSVSCLTSCEGLQGGNVSATVKHFAAFGSPEQGLNTAPVHGGERELRTTYLPSYKRQIIDAGAFSIMSAYSAYDGVPLVANYHILTEILREEWGYKYWVTSDAGATDRLCDDFKMCVAKPIDKEAVTLLALPSGNDVEMGGGSYNFENIPKLVQEGKLSIDIVDTAVSRLLRAKFEMGLFENPYLAVPANKTSSLIHTSETVALARQLDTESIVLLENHDSTLPLSKIAKVAVIGPMAHGYMNVGLAFISEGWILLKFHSTAITLSTGVCIEASRLLMGLKLVVEEVRSTKYRARFSTYLISVVTYAQGCERWDGPFDQSGSAEAIATASAADVAVVVVGTWSVRCFHI